MLKTNANSQKKDLRKLKYYALLNMRNDKHLANAKKYKSKDHPHQQSPFRSKAMPSLLSMSVKPPASASSTSGRSEDWRTYHQVKSARMEKSIPKSVIETFQKSQTCPRKRGIHFPPQGMEGEKSPGVSKLLQKAALSLEHKVERINFSSICAVSSVPYTKTKSENSPLKIQQQHRHNHNHIDSAKMYIDEKWYTHDIMLAGRSGEEIQKYVESHSSGSFIGTDSRHHNYIFPVLPRIPPPFSTNKS